VLARCEIAAMNAACELPFLLSGQERGLVDLEEIRLQATF